MNRNIQWYDVLSQIEELRKNTEYLLQQKLNISLIELDIALNKLSLIYDTLMTLKLQSAANEENGFFTKNSSLFSKLIKDSVFENSFDNKKQSEKDKYTNITIEEDIKKEEQLPKNNLETSNKPSHPIEETKQIKTLADALSKPHKTIAEKMEEMYKKTDLASSKQFTSIKDLKNAISLNDKIMFIRELFNNDVENYNYVINQINSCNNLDEALAIMEKNIKADSDNQALNHLLELVYRRFSN